MTIFCTQTIYFISVNCCYCFVRWAVCSLSVCRKINRQYKHNLSCTVHSHRRLYWQINRPSASHKELHKYWLYRRTQSVGISQRAVEMPQSLTWIPMDCICQHLSVVHNYQQNHRREFHRAGINASLVACTC